VAKSQYELCVEVLRRLDSAGVLSDVILVGSWCALFYKDFFGQGRYMVSLKTRDMDLLIPTPSTIKVQVDVAELLKDLGFIIGFTGSKGYIRIEHPDLIVEFLVPERGGGSNKPYPLPELGLNAQPLRFLEFLAQNTIVANVGGLSVRLPHPANFALHKLVVLSRRTKPAKRAKDKDAAMRVFEALISDRQEDSIKRAFSAMPRRWRGMVRKQLTDLLDKKVMDVLDARNAD
jgi:hypothetical protein